MPEGLSATEVGKEIAEHYEHAVDDARRDRIVSIIEAVLLSVVALLAAWSGYSAAKWGTESSISLAKASSTRTKASLVLIEAAQIRTLDSVSFNAAEAAYVAAGATNGSTKSELVRATKSELFRLTVKRMRPGYRAAFIAWLATDPVTNPNAPGDPSEMPQYRLPQETQGLALSAQADAYFSKGQSAAGTADKYVRLTVLLAAVLFLVGIGSRFPIRSARYGLIGVAGVLLVLSVVQLLSLPGPPS